MADEFAYLIAFNGKMKVLGAFEIGHGTGNACLLDARGIFMRAVYTGASCVVLVHTHPSGDTTPSRQDSELTVKIHDAGELIGIPLIDHIIVGGKGYMSFHEMGLL